MLRATLRSFLAHKGRLLMSGLAVVLSVAFVAGSLIFSDTLDRTFDQLFASTAADVTVRPEEGLDETLPSGRIATLPAALADRVAGLDQVAAARVDVEVENITVVDARRRPVSPTTGAPTTGADWDPAGRRTVELGSGHAPRGPGQAVLDEVTADRADVRIGDTLTVIAPPGSFPVEVVGIAAFTAANPGTALLFLDTPVAQERLLGDARAATGISVDAAEGVDAGPLKRRVADALGPDAYTYRTAAEQAESDVQRLGGFLDVLKWVMLGFAGVAVLVGVFLIVNTFSMLIAQRTRELGLLRALGADRRQVRRSVLTEALLLGVTGATLGLAAGVGLAAGLIRVMNAIGMHIRSTDMVIGWATPVAGYAVGIGVTFVAAYLPARRAAAVSPMAAIAETEAAGTGRPLRTRARVGAVVGAVGAAALAGCAVSSRTGRAAPLLGSGVALTLVATVVAGPLLVRPVIRVLGASFPALFGAVGVLSRRNALRNPRRTGATAAALMVGIALAVGLSVAGASITASFDRQIDRTLGSDFIVRNGNSAPFPREVTDAVRRAPGAGLVVPARYAPVAVRLPDGERMTTTATAYGPGLDEVADIDYAHGDGRAALAPGRLAMDTRFAREHGVRPGGTVLVEFQGGRTAVLTVGALTGRESAERFRTPGGLFLSLATLERYAPGGQDAVLYVNAAPGTGDDELRTALERSLAPYPHVQVRDLAGYKELVRDQIAVLLYLVYALLGLAIVIAVLGVVNTLALSVVERTREIGLLRAIGLSRRGLRRMIRLESVVIAVFGAVLGLALGLVWGVCTQRVLALEGMTVLAVPWDTVVAVVLGSVAVGIVAALLPASRASHMNVLAAIAHE
ncbi:membrane protein [Streptomyces leeuwenhoekii]|uniref:Membrane protein n=1 Tax=Streptomyces leeuwenhoekii TaxID=1437453 RepID=A0ABR5HY62_STRLW|nr:FtsX-like permease family protein [Streptomyces leeuwenhoekii]KMS78648.1 membrane protein [Streptomyces leeuwenhoekii]